MGRALMENFHFERSGVALSAAFDVAPDVVGQTLWGAGPPRPVGEYLAQHPASIGVLTVPGDKNNRIAGRLVASGVKGIWNFTNIELMVDAPDIVIENVHFADSLLALSYDFGGTMKRLAVGLLALVILIGCAAVYAADMGTGGEPCNAGLPEHTYIPDVLRQARARIAEQTKTVTLLVLRSECQAQRLSGPAGGEQSYAASITDFALKGRRGRPACRFRVTALAGSGTVSYSGGQCGGYYSGADRGLRHRADTRHRVLAAEKYHSGSDNHL